MNVYEMMGQLAGCLAGSEVVLLVDGEMREVEYVAGGTHDGACCFVAAKPDATAEGGDRDGD